MKDLKPVVAKNIAELRSSYGMTQSELAEKLNYSDKSISKWERAESIPDINVLTEIAQLFNVTLDYLVTAEHEQKEDNAAKDIADQASIQADDAEQTKPPLKKSIIQKIKSNQNHVIITALSILLVWFIATLSFVITDIIVTDTHMHWIAFSYAVPASMIVVLVFNSVWFNTRQNYLIISLLMWSLLASIYLTLLPFGINVWQIFLLGIPGQIIIITWSQLIFKPKSKINNNNIIPTEIKEEI